MHSNIRTSQITVLNIKCITKRPTFYKPECIKELLMGVCVCVCLTWGNVVYGINATCFLNPPAVHKCEISDSHSNVAEYLKIYVIWQSNTTFYCIKYISKWYLTDHDNYMLWLSVLSHLQVATLGYFNKQLTMLLSTRSCLHTFF